MSFENKQPFLYLGVNFASSIILLNSSLACISLFFFSFLSSSARVFTYWSNTWRKPNHQTDWRRQMNGQYMTRDWKQVTTRGEKKTWEREAEPVSSLLGWAEGSVGQTQSYEALCPRLRMQTPVRETMSLLERQPNIKLYMFTFPPPKTFFYTFSQLCITPLSSSISLNWVIRASSGTTARSLAALSSTSIATSFSESASFTSSFLWVKQPQSIEAE